MKNKLLKPIYPARDLNYSPTYKNTYNKVNNFSVISQGFGENNGCIKKDGTGNVVPKIGEVCPQDYMSVYEYFGMKGHSGIDIPCINGTPVFASLEGIVMELQMEVARGLGIGIISEQKYDWNWNGLNGTNQIKHRYWHLQSINIKVGDKVKAGDLIGLANNTGYTSGSHLHIEIKPVRKKNN